MAMAVRGRARPPRLLTKCSSSPSPEQEARRRTDKTTPLLRRFPLYVSATGFVALIANKAASDGGFTASATSPQSRAEVAGITIAASLALTGLTWIALEPSQPTLYPLAGEDGGVANERETHPVVGRELEWAHEAIVSSSLAESTALLFRGRVRHLGGPRPWGAGPGDHSPELSEVFRDCSERGRQAYIPSLAAFPARADLAGIIPENSRSIVVHGVGEGEGGILVASSGGERAFSPADRAWLASIAEKLSTTIARVEQQLHEPAFPA